MSDPSNPAYCILYDDKDRCPEVFVGAGSAFFARQRYRQAKDSWTCHLMMEIFPDAPQADTRLSPASPSADHLDSSLCGESSAGTGRQSTSDTKASGEVGK